MAHETAMAIARQLADALIDSRTARLVASALNDQAAAAHKAAWQAEEKVCKLREAFHDAVLGREPVDV